MLPGCATNRTEECRLCSVFTVGFHGTWSNRNIPDFRTCRIGSYCPAVVPVESLPRLRPPFSCIAADSDACASATTFVDPVSACGMEGKGMAVAQRAPAVSTPCLAAIEASHHRSSLDSNNHG